MNDKFDELAKAMAQPIGRRAALKKFSVGLVGAALALLGLVNNARADKPGTLPAGTRCRRTRDCQEGLVCGRTGFFPWPICHP